LPGGRNIFLLNIIKVEAEVVQLQSQGIFPPKRMNWFCNALGLLSDGVPVAFYPWVKVAVT